MLSAEVGCEKPDPSIYATALAALGVSAADTWFVDDQERFCTGATALGLTAFRTDRGATGGSATSLLDIAELLELP